MKSSKNVCSAYIVYYLQYRCINIHTYILTYNYFHSDIALLVPIPPIRDGQVENVFTILRTQSYKC